MHVVNVKLLITQKAKSSSENKESSASNEPDSSERSEGWEFSIFGRSESILFFLKPTNVIRVQLQIRRFCRISITRSATSFAIILHTIVAVQWYTHPLTSYTTRKAFYLRC